MKRYPKISTGLTPDSITLSGIRKDLFMAKPKIPIRASRSGERATPPSQEDEEFSGRRQDICLSDRDRDQFLALLDSDEEPNEALRQAACRFKRTHG